MKDKNTKHANLEKYTTAMALNDGSMINLRAIGEDDADKLLSFYQQLSSHSIYLRFLKMVDLTKEMADQYVRVDYDNTFAVVAIHGEGLDEKIIGVGRYWRHPDPYRNKAEMAFVVEDAYQKKGIGTNLLDLLAVAAREHGIDTVEVEMLQDNEGITRMIQQTGYELTDKFQGAKTWRGTYSLIPGPFVASKSSERERRASIASISRFMKPRSIAILGASNKPGIGNAFVKNLVTYGYTGIVYPINPGAEVVSSIKTYPSIMDVPGEVDLAILVVAAEKAQPLVEECAKKGVKGLVVITAGFSEMGGEGIEREKKLIHTARAYGMRVIGPNCLGILNTDPAVSMNATFAPVFPFHGKVALGTQSGALGGALLAYCYKIGLGLSNFVSIGNRADVSDNELLQCWAEDKDTDIILLYLESFADPRRFIRIARETTAKKPILVVKGGSSSVGARAASSHTGAMMSADIVSDALFRQAGMIRCNTLEKLFSTATFLANQPLPKGKKVAVLTNGGGAGIMAADALSAENFQLPVLSEKMRNELKTFLPPKASYLNPIDTTAAVSPDQYKRTLRLLLEEDIDAVVVIYIPPIRESLDFMKAAIREVAPEYRAKGIPIMASYLGVEEEKIGLPMEDNIPRYTFPEATAFVLGKAYEYYEHLRKPAGRIPQFEGIDKKAAEAIIAKALTRSPSSPVWLDSDEISDIFSIYGIRSAQSRIARTDVEAAETAGRIGYPVAVKLFSPTITHKTDVGGVLLNLKSAQEVIDAYHQISRNIEKISRISEMKGVTVQKMLSGGVELIVGVTQDKNFGPLIMFGLGGIYAELFKDVNFRIHPLTDIDAEDMISAFKSHKILDGWRGAPPSDIAAIKDLLLRISALVEDLPEIQEMDLNPIMVMATGQGCYVADARISVKPLPE
ncbi:MAG TPA: GNAT family N-acetyltransferase [Smithella sp.]|nr:GNAT family N-acetyltransferase [Smithella sp.]